MFTLVERRPPDKAVPLSLSEFTARVITHKFVTRSHYFRTTMN